MTEIEAHRIVSLFRDEWDKNSKTPNAHALDIALKSLEKHIKKKVINKHNSVNVEEQEFYGEDTLFADCPHCGGLNCSLWNFSNCGDCGQKIDWSVSE